MHCIIPMPYQAAKLRKNKYLDLLNCRTMIDSCKALDTIKGAAAKCNHLAAADFIV